MQSVFGSSAMDRKKNKSLPEKAENRGRKLNKRKNGKIGKERKKLKRKEIKGIDRRRDENYGGRVASGTNGRKYANAKKPFDGSGSKGEATQETQVSQQKGSETDPKLTEKYYQKQGGRNEDLKPSKRMRKVELGRKVKEAD